MVDLSDCVHKNVARYEYLLWLNTPMSERYNDKVVEEYFNRGCYSCDFNDPCVLYFPNNGVINYEKNK